MKGGVRTEDAVLVVDDEPGIISALRRTLMDEGYEVYAAGSGPEGLRLLEGRKVKVVISDEKMPGMSGTEFLSIVKERHPETVRIMLTGHASVEAAMNAVNNGEIYRFFTKPWNGFELKFAVRSAVEKYDLERENRRLLSMVRSQALELRLLERRYPNIARLERDEKGCLILPDISEAELSEIVAECEREFG